MTKTLSFKALIISGILALAAMLTLPLILSTAPAGAQDRDAVCAGLGFTGIQCEDLPPSCTDGDPRTRPNPGEAGCETQADRDISGLTTTILNILSIVVGVVSVIMIIIGGLMYVLSGGDSNQTKKAKDAILYALVGLVIVAFSQIIVVFVLSRV